MTFLSLAELREIEIRAIDASIDLIDRAANAAFLVVKEKIAKNKPVLVLIGRGNNGADGLALTKLLINAGYKVDYIRLFPDNVMNNEKLYQELRPIKLSLKKLPANFNKYGLIIDAIYGIGLNHELDLETIRVINQINSSNAYILSLDVPSGLNPFTAKVFGSAVRADCTLSFISDKPGFHTGDGLDCSGEVLISQLWENITPSETNKLSLEFNSLTSINYYKLMRTQLNTNKGSYGTVAIIGGNRGMSGALVLAGQAALSSGAGKVVLGSLDNKFSFSANCPELVVMPAKEVVSNLQAYNVVVIGPGLSQSEKAYKILDSLLSNIEDSKLIIDADALNLIASNPELKYKLREVREKIITPHPGEAARLLSITVNEVQDNRFLTLTELSTKLNAITLLKGAGSLINYNQQVFINTTGNPGLANAGQGDVLNGVISSFIAQGLDLIDALRLAVYVHGLAADQLFLKYGGYHGIIASKIIQEISLVINHLFYQKVFACEE